MENLHLLFNKTMYDNLGNDKEESQTIKESAQSIVNAKFYEQDIIKAQTCVNQTFRLKTVYPGLLAGTGYAHGISNEEDIKVGFSFDYVTGQPYIPGSSVKGVLRSIFDKTEIIGEILEENEIKFPENCDKKELTKEITKDIFDNNDVFLDAVVIHGNSKGHVMGFDSITPHDSPIKNPTPLKIIKVLPEVIFEFRFALNDTVILDKSGNEIIKITKGKKKYIFKYILTEFGIGAKTNTGYGIFGDNVTDKDISYPSPEKESGENHNVRPPFDSRRNNDDKKAAQQNNNISGNNNRTAFNDKLETGQIYEATVEGVKEHGVFVRLTGRRESGFINSRKLPGFDKNSYSIGSKISVKYEGTYTGKDGKEKLSFSIKNAK